jgi:hypothetical protein
MTFKIRIWLWLAVILIIPIGIFIYERGYNADAVKWIIGVTALAVIVETIYKLKGTK